MKTPSGYNRKKHEVPLRRGAAQDLHVLEKRPKIAREVQLVSTLNYRAPDEEFLTSGPSRGHLEFRDQPDDFCESSAVIVSLEQIPHQICSVGQGFFSNQRERVFPGFEGRVSFATEVVG
jgi:hypothetical protein